MVALDTTVDTPPLGMDVVLATPGMPMESALLMLSLRQMLSMVLMDMADMVLDAELILLAMVDTTVDTLPLVMDAVLAMDMVMDMPAMAMASALPTPLLLRPPSLLSSSTQDMLSSTLLATKKLIVH